MISRRLLRIKILQTLYSYFKSGETSFVKAEKELFFSIKKSYDMYYYLMLLIIDIVKYSEKKIELAKKKHITSFEDLNPNTRFVKNKLVLQLSENKDFLNYLEQNKMSWINNPELIKKLYAEIVYSEEYKKFMSDEKDTYSSHKNIIISIFKKQIAKSELLDQILEEQSIFWNSDFESVFTMIIRTLKKFKVKDKNDKKLMSLYSKDEDLEFVKILFRKSIDNYGKNIKLIEKFTKSWDIDRISFIDFLLIEIAVSEIIEFESIPVNVSLNEYIEISKLYGSKKNTAFVNGILDKIVKYLRKEKMIKKTGRGLI